MKLLVVTQKVDRDDGTLGFFFSWLEALAKRCDELTVICLERGAGSLPANVRVFSLGKEKQVGQQASRLGYLFNFYRYVIREWAQYDRVFVHMNQEYVLLAGWLWRLGGKKVTMWRNHAQGSFFTTLAVFFCQTVFCTSPTSYTARFGKTVLMPVGVDTDFFSPHPVGSKMPVTSIPKKTTSILFLARMAPVKRPDLLIEAAEILISKTASLPFSISLYGNPLPKDQAYYEALMTRSREHGLTDCLSFHRGVPYRETPPLYRAHDFFINLTPVGSFDKTIVEALACGVPVLTANTDLAADLPAVCIIPANTPEAVAEAIYRLLATSESERQKILTAAQPFIHHHSLAMLIAKLTDSLMK